MHSVFIRLTTWTSSLQSAIGGVHRPNVDDVDVVIPVSIPSPASAGSVAIVSQKS